MQEDWFVTTVDEIELAAAALQVAVAEVVATLRAARLERGRPVDLLNIVKGRVVRGRTSTRLAPTDAFRRLEHSLTVFRAEAIRSLVEDEHLTFSEIGRMSGVSRQMVARLYRMAATATDGSERDEPGAT